MFGPNQGIIAVLEDRQVAQPALFTEFMRLGDSSAAAPEAHAVFGSVHVNLQHISIRDRDAVDGALRHYEQTQELALTNHRFSIELKAFEWKYSDVSRVRN